MCGSSQEKSLWKKDSCRVAVPLGVEVHGFKPPSWPSGSGVVWVSGSAEVPFLFLLPSLWLSVRMVIGWLSGTEQMASGSIKSLQVPRGKGVGCLSLWKEPFHP